MAHQVESMAYRFRDRSDVPWHGLGHPITQEMSPDEMLVAAELDWRVAKTPLLTRAFTKDNRNVEILVDDFFGLVRDKDSSILGICGKEYVPTQNVDAFAFFKKFCEAGKMTMETAGSLQKGRQVWVLAKIAGEFELPGGDRVGGYLLLSSPHIWGKSLIIKFVAIRVVCANTLTMALGEEGRQFRMPHVRAFDAAVAVEAEEALGLSSKMLADFGEKAGLLTKAKVDDQQVIRYIADVFQPELIRESIGASFYSTTPDNQARVLVTSTEQVDSSQFKKAAAGALSAISQQPGADLESARGTAWGMLNAATYYVDHVSGRGRDNALTAAWFGPKATLKTKALDRALAMSRVLVGQ